MRRKTIISFPTRVDTDVFYPRDRMESQEEMGVPKHVPVFVTSGRLSWQKGWDLLIEAFRLFTLSYPDAHLYFVGEGEERHRMESRCRERGLEDRVHISGACTQTQVAAYLNASHVFVLGSHFEGWPTAMVEALATGVPIVSTAVSAAAELITEGVNGHILQSRDPQLFCNAMADALSLDARSHSVEKAGRYAVSRLAEDLGDLWAPLGK
jgi:glycosyltransferase involved in cell wall biosynthesis